MNVTQQLHIHPSVLGQKLEFKLVMQAQGAKADVNQGTFTHKIQHVEDTCLKCLGPKVFLILEFFESNCGLP